MGIILWVVFGALIGWLAFLFIQPQPHQRPTFNVIIGVIGAVMSGWLMSAFSQNTVTTFDFYTFVFALCGAIVLIATVKISWPV